MSGPKDDPNEDEWADRDDWFSLPDPPPLGWELWEASGEADA